MGDGYRTLDLNQAAAFLHMSPAVLRQKACAGIIKGAKPGKCWVFLENDLADYLHSLYSNRGQAPQSDRVQEKKPCHSSNAATSGGCDLAPPAASKYASLLKLPTNS
ncbi:helix-turn-helix domain-containing protein [Sedimenticola selenatireducens]|uniref:helix-turn-helix domain-containing protein n=1 Tax=Sedimenticola selenatireducens TaxID=191960 RepID=UPI0009FD07B7